MLARRMALVALSKLRDGRITVVEGGRATSFGPGGSLAATVTVHDARFWSALVRRGRFR